MDQHAAGSRGGDLAVEIAGGPARDIAASELQIAAWSTADDRLPQAPPAGGPGFGSIDARFLSEGAIRGRCSTLSRCDCGDEISMSAQRLSERRVIGAALGAAERGVRVAMLLDRTRRQPRRRRGARAPELGAH